MAKSVLTLSILKTGLRDIGYEISDCIQRENNGINWQLKFNNSGAIVTIYDSNKIEEFCRKWRNLMMEKKKIKKKL